MIDDSNDGDKNPGMKVSRYKIPSRNTEPGEKKEIRGKMYLMKNDINAFLKIYDQEFPSNK